MTSLLTGDQDILSLPELGKAIKTTWGLSFVPNQTDIADFLADMLEDYNVMDLNKLVLIMETIYGRKDELGPNAMALGAVIARTISAHNFHGKSERASQITLALLRDAGETSSNGVSFPDESSDPEPEVSAPVEPVEPE